MEYTEDNTDEKEDGLLNHDQMNGTEENLKRKHSIKDEEKLEEEPSLKRSKSASSSEDMISKEDSNSSEGSKEKSGYSSGQKVYSADDDDTQSFDSALNLSKKDDDSSTVKSEDSEKENVNVDLPMDLSKTKSQDVITLSDEEEESKLVNGHDTNIVKRLQSELRNEDAKLVLLKKLRQSQLSHQLQEINKPQQQQQQQRQQGQGPPPLVRGTQPSQNSKPQNHVYLNEKSPLMRTAATTSGSRPPPLMMRPQISPAHAQTTTRSVIPQGTTNPNLLNYRTERNLPGVVSQQQQLQQSQHIEPPQSAAQRQAAAKLALRKQLEKTLLQIPPPKPPPPEMNFIPSLACPDFILLLGLEEVVNYIVDADMIAKGRKNPDEKLVCNPFSCCQCYTDFTPVWKREKPGSKNVVCEYCVTTNQKKALKQEHTNRLKSAFVKALQQEQEIERMQANSLSSSSSATTSQATTPLSVTQSFAQSFKSLSAEHFSPQNLLQAHQAQLRSSNPIGMQPFMARGSFPYNIPFTKAAEIQRQYLLDLIPHRGVTPWKS